MKSQPQKPVFLLKLFELIASRHTCHDTDRQLITSVQAAVCGLLQALNVPREYVAVRVGITPSQVAQLEIRGKPVNPATMKRFADLAAEFSLPNLAWFFDSKSMKASRGKPQRKAYGTYKAED